MYGLVCAEFLGQLDKSTQSPVSAGYILCVLVLKEEKQSTQVDWREQKVDYSMRNVLCAVSCVLC